MKRKPNMSRSPVFIQRCGALLDLSELAPSGQLCPVSEHTLRVLSPALTYSHVEHLFGADRFDEISGEMLPPVVISTKPLYSMFDGRVRTGIGALPAIHGLLTQAGYSMAYRDLSPRRLRPGCYQPDWSNFHARVSLRPGQLELMQAIAASEGGLIDSSVGFGKSFNGLVGLAALYPQAKIAFAVRGISTVTSLATEAMAHIGTVGLVTSKKYMPPKRVTLYSLDSLHHCEQDIDFLIVDEVDTAAKDSSFLKVCSAGIHSRNFGLTGTLTRADNAHHRLVNFFGPVIFRVTVKQSTEAGNIVPLRVRWINCRRGPSLSDDLSSAQLKREGIWLNDQRNADIARFVYDNYKNNEQILISVETIAHAVALSCHLPDFTLCYGSNASEKNSLLANKLGLVDGLPDMSSEARLRLQTAFRSGELRRVIATDVWSTGVSFERLQVLIRADARSSARLATQWPGRAVRLFEGKQYAELVDVWDSWSPKFVKTSRRKASLYKKNGWLGRTPESGAPRRQV